MTEVDVGRLIRRIGPLNNEFRDSEGYAKVAIMWEVGDILHQEGVTKVHSVAWEVQSKSYITRDMLSYCYRIRREWEAKTDLKAELGGLKSFSAFRHAFPLLENPKYRVTGKEREQVLEWILSLPPNAAIARIMKLKESRIGIRNDRSKRLSEVRDDQAAFRQAYDALRDAIRQGGDSLTSIRSGIGDKGLLAASQMCIAIMNEGYKAPSELDLATWPETLRPFGESLAQMATAGKLVKARLRRVVPDELLFEMSDMLNAIRTDAGVEQVKKRMAVKLRL